MFPIIIVHIILLVQYSMNTAGRIESGFRPVSGTRQKPFLGHILLHGKSESVQLCLQLPEGDEKMKYG